MKRFPETILEVEEVYSFPSRMTRKERKITGKDTMKFSNRSIHYQICLEGILDERWLRWFEGLEVNVSGDDQTIIRGEFDQSALHGLFNRIHDLGFTIISVQRHPGRKESSV